MHELLDALLRLVRAWAAATLRLIYGFAFLLLGIWIAEWFYGDPGIAPLWVSASGAFGGLIAALVVAVAVSSWIEERF
jgi:membrane associated rhomboid family serine protease